MNTNQELILECNAKAFKDVLKHVNATKSFDENRAFLYGVRFFLESERLTLTSTDGNRLSERRLEVDSKISSFSEINTRDYLILKTDKDFTKILSAINKETVLKVYLEKKEKGDFYTFEVEVKEKITAFNDSQTEIKGISLRDITGNYPNYKAIIPREEVLQSQIIFKAKKAIQFLGDLKKFVGGSWNRDKRIVFYKVNGRHYVSYEKTSDEIIDKEIDFIECSDLKEGEPLALNVTYFLDSIEDKPEIAIFKTEDFIKSVIYRCEGGKIDLVMPMNSQDVKLPTWEKKKELLESKKPSSPSPKEIPNQILAKNAIKGQGKSKKTKELLKKEFNIQFKTSPRLYQKFTFQINKGASGYMEEVE